MSVTGSVIICICEIVPVSVSVAADDACCASTFEKQLTKAAQHLHCRWSWSSVIYMYYLKYLCYGMSSHGTERQCEVRTTSCAPTQVSGMRT